MSGYEVVCLTNLKLEKEVRDLVMSRDIQAIQFIPVWWARVGRIPAGVDTTHSLLVAITTTQHAPLSLATGRGQVVVAGGRRRSTGCWSATCT